MPLDSFRRYFKQGSYANLNTIRNPLFPREYINPKEIIPRYTRVFGTLWSLGNSQNIKEFIQHTNLEDMNLSFVPDNSPNNLPQTLEQSDFWCDFWWEQRRFFAQEFESPVLSLPFEDERVPPINYKKRLDGGGTSTLLPEKQYAPATDENIIQLRLWEGLFEVMNGLGCTYTLEPFGSEGGLRIFQGYVSQQVSGLLPPYLVSNYADFGLQMASRY
jgi:hypothetical protein